MLAALEAGEMTDTIRSSLEWVLQQLIAAETTAVIGAGPQVRTETPAAQRNGHRPKLLSLATSFRKRRSSSRSASFTAVGSAA